MLLVEQRAIVDLRAATRGVLGELVLSLGGVSAIGNATTARVWALTAVATAAKEVARRISRSVLEARRSARATALIRIAAESGSAPPPPSDAAEDAGLADAAAASYGAAWSAAVTRAVLAWADDPRGMPPIKAASDSQDYRLARIAATEVSQAYNDEHEEAGRTLRRPGAVRRWEAMLDRRVCKVCREMDGKTTPLGGSFAGGREPGFVHPVCRCIAVIDGVEAAQADNTARPASSKIVGENRGAVFVRGPGSGYQGGGGTFGGGGSSDSY